MGTGRNGRGLIWFLGGVSAVILAVTYPVPLLYALAALGVLWYPHRRTRSRNRKP